jgi:hypothetical protein
MRALITLAVAVVAIAACPALAAERACRPSLSNGYHCPDGTNRSGPTSETTSSSDRACRPSLSNFWTCPEKSQAKGRSASTGRTCRPSLSNGYSCPKTPSANEVNNAGSARPRRSVQPEERDRKSVAREEGGCRPSLSNGFKCPALPSTANRNSDQYDTEAQAEAHCPRDTVVWLNTRSGIYHFQGTSNYGNTVAGAYMCERESLRDGMRAAKNETHP